jgi:hypothetical protein
MQGAVSDLVGGTLPSVSQRLLTWSKPSEGGAWEVHLGSFRRVFIFKAAFIEGMHEGAIDTLYTQGHNQV